MAFISLIEIFDIIVMASFIGFLFMDIIRLEHNETKWTQFKRAVIAISPAIIFHELAHKFVAMSFGLEAVFKAFYHQGFTLGLGILAVIAKLSNFGFMFLVPGYVQMCPGNEACMQLLIANPLWGAVIAFAGPAVHLILWITSIFMLKKKKLKDSHVIFWALNKKINMFLFILNMLPIPGIDGMQVYTSIFRLLG